MCTPACVPTVWASCLRKVHPILFLQEKTPYSCKINQRIDLGLLSLTKIKQKNNSVHKAKHKKPLTQLCKDERKM